MTEIEKHQQAHLKIYKEMLGIAVKNNIKIHAVYGTMLGLVRHNGFIPWDDDIDISVWDDEYEKYIDCLERELKPPFRVTRRSKDWSGNCEIATVEDTSQIVFGDKERLHERLYCVDIFRHGFLKPKYKKIPFSRNFWKGILFVGIRGDRSKSAKFARWLIRHTLPGKYVHNKVRKIHSKISTHDPFEATLAFHLTDGWNKAHTASTWIETEVKKIDGVEFLVPKYPDSVLTADYGDWKKPVDWHNVHYN